MLCVPGRRELFQLSAFQRYRAAEPVKPQNRNILAGAHFGILYLPGDGLRDVERLLSSADPALIFPEFCCILRFRSLRCKVTISCIVVTFGIDNHFQFVPYIHRNTIEKEERHPRELLSVKLSVIFFTPDPDIFSGRTAEAFEKREIAKKIFRKEPERLAA